MIERYENTCCPGCYANGVEAERERIIALLEVEWWMRPSNKARLIALIKGDETRIVQDDDATDIKGEQK